MIFNFSKASIVKGVIVCAVRSCESCFALRKIGNDVWKFFVRLELQSDATKWNAELRKLLREQNLAWQVPKIHGRLVVKDGGTILEEYLVVVFGVTDAYKPKELPRNHLVDFPGMVELRRSSAHGLGGAVLTCLTSGRNSTLYFQRRKDTIEVDLQGVQPFEEPVR